MRHLSIVFLLVLVQAIYTSSFFAEKCHDYCGLNSSKCLSNGRCLCEFGWTGPNAAYITSGPREGMIVADFCMISCQYNLLFHNPDCVNTRTTINPPIMHPAVNIESCTKSCGKSESAGRCLSNEKCLCWWGWTGNNAMYVNDGPYKNRIVADDCMISCHYTHDYRNPYCIRDNQDDTTPIEETNPHSTMQPSITPSQLGNTNSTSDIITNTTLNADTVTSEIPPSPSTHGFNYTHSPQAACDPKCEKFGQGKCQSDGSCLCWWGWTGPNATYITTGNLTNRIKAKYCTEPCHYTHDYINASCATIPTPKTCDIPSNSTPQLPCLPRCGQGVFHGECLRNGRCLCWWGWTGPHSCFVDGGDYNNRIIADYCEEPCHYTHDYRNESCVKSEDTSSTIQGSPISLIPTATSSMEQDTSVSSSSDVPSSGVTESTFTTEQATTIEQSTMTEDTTAMQEIYATVELTTPQISTTEQLPVSTDEYTIVKSLATGKLTTTEIPTTMEQHPTTTEQITTTEHPTTTEQQPTVTEHLTTSEHPTTTEQHPTTGFMKPTEWKEPLEPTEETESIDTTRPTEGSKLTEATEVNKDTDVIDPMLVIELSDSTEATRPTEQLTTTESPTTTEQHPTTTEQITTTEHPTTTEQQPTVTEHLTTSEHPTITEQHPTTGFMKLTEWKEPLEPTEKTVVIDPMLMIEPSESIEATRPTETSKLTEATEVTEDTDVIDPMLVIEPSESVEATRPTEASKLTEATEVTEDTDVIDPMLVIEPSESIEATRPTEGSKLTEATEVNKDTDVIDPMLVFEPSDSTEATRPTEQLKSAEAVQPNKHMEINHGLEKSNQDAQDPASKEQSPAETSIKQSSASKLSVTMVALGTLVIIIAVVGLATMVKHHGKCFKSHVGYRQLGDNAYFTNEKEMSYDLTKVL